VLKIRGREISALNKPFVVAELSANHGGDIQRAIDAITAAKQCGADAVKIQTYEPRSLTLPLDGPDFTITDGPWKGQTLYDLYRMAYTPFAWHEMLFAHAEKIGIPIFSSPFDEEGIELLDRLGVPAFKIASFELTDIPFIKAVARRQKPIIISTGLGSLDEIAEAVEAVQSISSAGLMLLHCISNYPAKIEDCCMQNITILRDTFNVEIGLSDHTTSNLAAITAIALGACVIEIHFKLDHSDEGPDSMFSITPDVFQKLILDCNDAWTACGSVEFRRPLAENENRKFRRSLYFVENLKSGELISNQSIKSIRPGYGLHPKYFDEVVGRRVRLDVKIGDRVCWDFLEGERG